MNRFLTEDISQILPPLTVNRDYAVPGVAGYSWDGNTVFIHKDLPQTFETSNDIEVNVDLFLCFHEATEKQFMDRFGMSYPPAHEIATTVERFMVEKAGIDWWEYDAWMQNQVQRLKGVPESEWPPELDTRPNIRE